MPLTDLISLSSHPSAHAPEVRPLVVSAVLEAWRAGKRPLTLDSYVRDIGDFARWCVVPPEAAIARFLSLDVGRAHQVALAFLEHLSGRALASATVNRRLAALRSVVKAARLIGMVSWSLELPAPKTAPYRDTRGPGRAGFMRLVAHADQLVEPLRSRNLALLWLMYGRALRRSEVVSLTLPDDLDLAGNRVHILGKHRRDREWVTIPPATVRAIVAWLAVRSSDPGPLFYRLDRASRTHSRQPLTGRGVQHIIGHLGNAIGIRARPHGLRHAGITEVLDVTRGDHRAAQRFGRLRSANLLNYYDDNREDVGGEAAKIIAP